MGSTNHKLQNAIIYLFGVPAAGKYTVAKKISELTGARLVDNQLINIPVFSILGYNGKDDFPFPSAAWEHISAIRTAVMNTIRECCPPDESFVFTNVLEQGDPNAERQFGRLLELAEQRNATFVPVRVLCDFDDIRRRKENVDRKERYKDTDLTNIPTYENDYEVFRTDHKNGIEINTSKLTASESAEAILTHIAGLSDELA